ncbi:FLYWCH zinc finger domain-containing protein [Ditylenchus destructor]|uniref:FLYWCH zinc finger domain-containing protein n=1 Tax=Ditylenchus destructor TaxID=166010 RepID=A0AAD4MWT4_9BILA|nr:FLYWCH zinc finger domain-containing protein [Ditylenchus destructor]
MTEKHRNVPQGINYELQYTEKIMPMLVFNGYYHHFNGSRDTIEGQVYYWRCVKRAELGVDKCSGTASVKENPDKQWQAYAGRTQHNHEPNAIQASIRTFQHELRSEALNGAKATREVVKESVEKMPEYAKALVDPSPASKIVRKVRRKRKLETNIPLSEHRSVVSLIVEASVAVAVSGDEENHLAVRRDVGNYIIKHREKCNRARCWCRTYNIPNDLLLESAQNCGDRDRWGSTLHLIAASKLYKIVILTYSQLESGLPSWTVHNPSMQTGTAPSMEQELVYPSVAFQIEANHCDVVLDVEPPL